MQVGRYICVALPFILTVGSIICFLIAGLTGVTNNSLYLFRIDLTDLSIDTATFQDLVNSLTNAEDLSNNITSTYNNAKETVSDVTSRSPEPQGLSNAAALIGGSSSSSSNNVTASDLGLADVYDFNLWGMCNSTNTTQTCSKAKFNWAEERLNISFIQDLAESAGLNVTIPDSVESTLTAFKTLYKWTEVVYIIAMIALGVEILIGLFTACSRLMSCLTWLIAGVACLFVIAAAAMMTALASVAVGAVKGATSKYGGDAHLNNSFLATIWIGVAFALGASLFWLFSVCCCKPENRPYSKKARGGAEGEKFIPTGSYAPLGDNHHQNQNTGYNNAYAGAPQRGGARSDLAYEPYSYSR
ncbi:SUR7/PalI family-domain-containing protein [Whalleya microplaca]|nr:SUR7/PalI family-domain-containing protein [Whalleya microplaca]